ncbi:hypothetical protein QTP70_013379 [Hemibagrus guttatus]|uniref:ribonuclease H n=1 Tax=Hemibagrus guttatus TaxID=175788 RepID=A0AAE0R9H9_9TELE|nr:hypothetical protein QTP70_013379 [Hemibagrus guttatus]
MVQQLGQKLRDFAYDYHALCLKWKVDITEAELVSRILNNINPRLAGCLRGTITTVEQLIKVGTRVEKDCLGAKDYWQKVGKLNPEEKGPFKQPSSLGPKELSGVSLAQPHNSKLWSPSLLQVPLQVVKKELQTMIDTGSSFALMRHSVWQSLGEWDADNQVELRKLMEEWPFATSNRLGWTAMVKHWISTLDEIPVKSRAYRVSPLKKGIIEDHIDKMVQDGIIEPSSSPWSSPVVLIPKPDQTYWFCVDYRNLNSRTIPDEYPMPILHDILESMEGAFWFTTLDLQSGYWQVEVEVDSKQKTAFITIKGLYQFTKMPYGLCNAAATFQRLMERVLDSLRGKTCFLYINDIIIYSPTCEQHVKSISVVMRRLTRANLSLNMKKCNFFKQQLKFLGHIISGKGIEVDKEKTCVVAEYPAPTDLKSLQRFLGLAGWYHKFIPGFADLAAPLNNLKKKGVNELGLGAILTQQTGEGEKVISFASRTLKGAELNYSTSEKECLAIVWAVEEWRHFVEGMEFEVFTDHGALAWAFNCPKIFSRLTRWTLRLQQFNFKVCYRKGCLNSGLDALSRAVEAPNNEAVPCLTVLHPHQFDLPHSLAKIANTQDKDPTIKQLRITPQHQRTTTHRISFDVQQGALYRKLPLKNQGEN